jgi:hypothetical protein
MNRLSFDSTAPRRPPRRRTIPGPRPEGLVEEEAELLRAAWDLLGRIGRR